MKSIFSIFSVLVFSATAFAQSRAVAFSESFQLINSTYQQIKGNLPAYFFTYGLAGLNDTQEGYVAENTMQARSYVVPIPVLITGEKKFSSYELWRAQFVKSNDAKKIDSSAAEENISAVTLEEKLSKDPSFANLDSASKAKMLKTEKTRLENEKKRELKLKEKETNVVSKNGNSEIEQNKNLPTAAAAAAEDTPFNILPDTIQAKLKEMGDKEGYKWLYEQQIIAGNVIFCDPVSLIPSAINLRSTEDVTLYLDLLKSWKQAYPTVWKNSTLEQHQILAKDLDAYFGAFGKASSLNSDFSRHFDLYNVELQRIIAK